VIRLMFAALLLAGMGADAAQRSRAEVRLFRQLQACPATGQHTGACPGWHVDHVTPLCSGGPDRPDNMQWISVPDHRWKTFVDVRECRKLRNAPPP